MRYQGKITDWKDEQGFGFVVPNGGGQKAFVHIKSFSNRSSRPAGGDLITYELAMDERNRFYAKDILYATQTNSAELPVKNTRFGIKFVILFYVLLGVLVITQLAPLSLIVIYIILGLITFLLYGADKSAAKNNHWRTKESTLHFFSLAGGWPGALIAQKMFRHKSAKKEFQTVFWATVIINCFTLGWLLTTKNGAIILNTFLS